MHACVRVCMCVCKCVNCAFLECANYSSSLLTPGLSSLGGNGREGEMGEMGESRGRVGG